MEHPITAQVDQLSFVLEATHSGMWEWNVRSGVLTGPGWRQLLKYSESEQISWPLLIYEDDFSDVINRLMQHVEGKTSSYISEHRLLNGEKKWQWVREHGRIVEADKQGWATRIIGITQIIDEQVALREQQRIMQEKLVHAEKMESIGQLTAGIAHDFNNLLASILGYAELSTEILPKPGKTENIREYLNQIISAGTRAKELIAQMLLFSRQNSDLLGDSPTPVLLKPVLTEVVHLAHSTIPSGIEVDCQMENEHVKASVHPVHMHQMLLNLVVNARDAIGQFGKIEIKQSTRKLHAQCASCHEDFHGDYVEISIRDTGCGIPAQLVSTIFEPFFTTKEIGKGTGMGLSVVHGIVHSLDGHILIDSQEGIGTTIRILLPAILGETASTVATTTVEHKHVDVQLSGKHILVVDDETAMSSMLSDFLDYYGAKVSTYNKPDKALSFFIRNPDSIDLLITDATMPGISGLELSRAILQIRPSLPILLCTGYSNFINADIARQNGIAGFMLKPLDLPNVLQWINEELNVKHRHRNGA